MTNFNSHYDPTSKRGAPSGIKNVPNKIVYELRLQMGEAKWEAAVPRIRAFVKAAGGFLRGVRSHNYIYALASNAKPCGYNHWRDIHIVVSCTCEMKEDVERLYQLLENNDADSQ